ncbi:monovalent cation/H+ antiporter complex subunit F [Haloferula sp. A504]|uniref:monovalent cation/H+ antiporter complex subunit F n=1 Tax=Haloferula sp. A504 TaxID=3373601 RepID=UPI0031CBA32B|nr:MrpF/PhaF family protein [Verrucomicrobiaceae bacterium E54]
MLEISTFLLALAIALTLGRLITCRDDADRVICVDLLTFQLLGLAVMLAFHDQRPLALQFAFVLSLLGFVSTLILSRLIRT